MTSSDRESVSDRLALEQFRLVRNLSYILMGTLAGLLVSSIAFPNRIKVETSGITGTMLTVLAYFLAPPGTQRKKEPEQQAIAQSGGLVVQEQTPEPRDNSG